MIRLKGLQKTFGTHRVLNDVSLTVGFGDVVAVLGPSGAGKTTLLRSVNFLDRADAGEVTVGDLTVSCQDASPSEILAIRRRTAMVFQSYNLFRHKTVLENVMEGPLIVQKKSRQDARDRGLAMLEKVGLIDKINAYPAQLSGGQQQRAGIARAMALEPEIILFDEPTSALDPQLVGEVLEVIRKVAAEGITMMIVTHELAFARDVASNIVFMADGRVVEEGTASAFFHRPQQDLTRMFIRSALPAAHEPDQRPLLGGAVRLADSDADQPVTTTPQQSLEDRLAVYAAIPHDL